MSIERLQTKDYDELISLLNTVFTRQNGKQMDFERDLPKLCVRDDQHMGCHFGLREEGKLVAAIGVYPLETVIAGERLRFSTTGNIVTHWDYEGKGYMSRLLQRAMQELEDLNVDASRLAGLRRRYNRYGFEACGQIYSFTFRAGGALAPGGFGEEGVEFSPVTAEDPQALAFCLRLHNQNAIAVPRTTETFLPTALAWRNQPFLARKNGTPIGYLCTIPSQGEIAEHFAVDAVADLAMLSAWQKKTGTPLNVPVQPHQIETLRRLSALADGIQIRTPCHFKLRRWERVAGALLRLKNQTTALPKGEILLGVEHYGTLRLFVTETEAGCELTSRPAPVTLPPLEAARYLFGPTPPELLAPFDPLAKAWLPLPLSWSGQDRV